MARGNVHNTEDQLLSLGSSLKHLWQAYGGWKGLLGSPYLWMAFVSTIVVSYLSPKDWRWYNVCLSVMPNILGFSLGGYAIMLAFGDGRFLNALRGPEPDGSSSPFIQASASLGWFVLCQIGALLAAIIADATPFETHGYWFLYYWQLVVMFLGCWIFMYAIFLAVAATMTVFFLSRMYDEFPDN